MPNHKRQSLLCPNCKKLISVSEKKCPYCGTGSPAAWWKNNIWTRGFSNPYLLVKSIIGVNIGIAAPMAFFPFCGMKDSFFGTLHGQGREAIRFFTESKVVIERWF